MRRKPTFLPCWTWSQTSPPDALLNETEMRAWSQSHDVDADVLPAPLCDWVVTEPSLWETRLHGARIRGRVGVDRLSTPSRSRWRTACTTTASSPSRRTCPPWYCGAAGAHDLRVTPLVTRNSVNARATTYRAGAQTSRVAGRGRGQTRGVGALLTRNWATGHLHLYDRRSATRVTSPPPAARRALQICPRHAATKRVAGGSRCV